MDEQQQIVFFLAGVPLLGTLAQWIAWRLRLPSILLLLGFGVGLGWFIKPGHLLSDLVGAEDPAGAQLLFPIVSLAVAIILFEGGLTLRLAELRAAAGKVVLRLVTIGALVTWILTAVAAWWLFGVPLRIAALIGAILVVTGPTVVAPMLRHIRPSRRVGSIVKWEGIVIDPIGAMLAVLVFEELLPVGVHDTFAQSVILLLRTVLIGGIIGLVTSWLLVQILARYWVPDILHGVIVLSTALGVFAISNALQHESGLVTVTVLGILLANQKRVSIHHIAEFKENLGVLLISCLFIVLGARLDPRDIWQLGLPGLAFLMLLVLVIRPVSVYLSTSGTELSLRERTFLAFLAPRGIVAAAVSSVFALRLATQGAVDERLAGLAEQSDVLVPITFLTIVGTVAIYGTLAAPLARKLQLADPVPQGILFASAEPWVRRIASVLRDSGFQVMLVDTDFAHVAEARMEGLPAECSSILSEHVREEMDLGGIGRLLAVTANDEVNALAAREYAQIFGRANVYQLSPSDVRAGKRSSLSERLRGRLLFCEGCNYEELVHRFRAGATVKKTQLTEEFTLNHFQALYGPSATLLFVINETRELIICTADRKVKPKPGYTVIALVDPTSSTPGSQETPPAA